MSASGPERRTTRNRRQADVTLGLHREILAHIADGVSVVSPVDLVILYASPRFEAMFGYGPGELIGRPVELLNADNGQPAALVAQAIVRALESRGSWAGELRNRRRDGSVFWTRASVLKRELPGWGHIYLSTQSDISELKQAEADMVESEQSFRSLVSTSMDAVLLTAPDGRILLANEAACRMFGRSETELIRLGRGGVVDPGDPRLGPALEQRRHSGRFQGVLTLLRADGSRFEGEISSVIFRNQEGEERSSMVIRDISGRLRADALLRRSEARLHALAVRQQEVREEERGRIAREVHDVLGQQLTGLTLDLAWLERRLAGVADTDLRRGLHDKLLDMRQLADDMMHSVQDIATELRPSALDRLGLAAALRFEARRLLRKADIACELELAELPPSLPPAHVTGLFRIYQELLVNIVRHAGATRVRVRLAPTAEGLLLEVRDNGRGIGEEELAGAASLGLMGMRERAAQLGGRLDFQTEAGKGTTARVMVRT